MKEQSAGVRLPQMIPLSAADHWNTPESVWSCGLLSPDANRWCVSLCQSATPRQLTSLCDSDSADSCSSGNDFRTESLAIWDATLFGQLGTKCHMVQCRLHYLRRRCTSRTRCVNFWGRAQATFQVTAGYARRPSCICVGNSKYK